MVPKIRERAPGAMPDIRADGDSVIYRVNVVGACPPLHLVLRCDRDGTVSASISVPASADVRQSGSSPY